MKTPAVVSRGPVSIKETTLDSGLRHAGMTILLALFLFSAPVLAKSSEDKVWVIVRPVQCLGNPWEKDWLARNKNQAAKYPRTEEFEVLAAYFARKKIPVLDIRVKPYVKGDMLCQACDCPRGDTLFLMIYAKHAPKMVRLGYTERMPASPAGRPADPVPAAQK